MMIVGLTGSFGTGKSFVADIFKKLGAQVVDADRLAHQALEKDPATYKKIVAAFGRSILGKDGAINRKALGKLVFGDKKKLAMLNRIIHPVVIEQIIGTIKTPGNKVLVIDAPLICETSLLKRIDVLVVVKASKKRQIKRCVKKFNLGEADVCRRIVCQMPLKKKIAKADYVIDNDGTRKETEKQVTKVWQEIKKGANVWR